MSQVLEKPILLDETGQEIAGKLDTNSAAIVDALDDIKDAIGTSSEFIPVMIKVVTPPTKTIYKVGERLDLSGMVVNLIGTNGVNIDVTQACTFVPANGATLTNASTSVAISYHYAADNLDFSTSQALIIRELDSIAVTTPPNKTAYQTGETLDLTGIVVTATYSDGYTANVTTDCIFSPANGTVLTSSDTSVGVNYTEGSVTKSTSVAIGVKELLSIAVTHLPVKTSYHAGEILDLTGIVVTATYDDSTTLNVTNNCVFSPNDGDALTTSDTSVSITYTEGSTTKTASQVITVIGLNSIAITNPPTQTEYTVGDALDLTGIVVTATYSDNSTAVVTSSCTFSPTDGTTLTTANTGVIVSYTEYGYTKTATQAITVEYPIYGAEWDGTSTTAWTRTDLAANFTDPVPYKSNLSGTPSSPFDTIQPWAGMVRVTDADVGELVAIPKYYYKWTKTGDRLKLQISTYEFDGSHVSPAHMDRGDGVGERDIVYVGRYHCADMYKSNTNQTPRTTSSIYQNPISTFRTNIHNLGTDIWQWDYAMRWTIMMLYLVEFADWDSQVRIGRGGKPSSQTSGYVGVNGGTDGVPYHTGTNGTGTGDGAVEYRNIEGLWGGGLDMIDGFNYSLSDFDRTAQIQINPANFGQAGQSITYSDGHSLPTYKVIKNWYIPTVDGYEWALLPLSQEMNSQASDSDYSIYVTDTLTFVNSGSVYMGSSVAQSYQEGLFNMGSEPASYGNVTRQLTCRLMKLPNS